MQEQSYIMSYRVKVKEITMTNFVCNIYLLIFNKLTF